MSRMAAENIIAALEGQVPPNLVKQAGWNLPPASYIMGSNSS
jgi:hypothetical protein